MEKIGHEVAEYPMRSSSRKSNGLSATSIRPFALHGRYSVRRYVEEGRSYRYPGKLLQLILSVGATIFLPDITESSQLPHNNLSRKYFFWKRIVGIFRKSLKGVSTDQVKSHLIFLNDLSIIICAAISPICWKSVEKTVSPFRTISFMGDSLYEIMAISLPIS